MKFDIIARPNHWEKIQIDAQEENTILQRKHCVFFLKNMSEINGHYIISTLMCRIAGGRGGGGRGYNKQGGCAAR